jgi:HEAT repeat protein
MPSRATWRGSAPPEAAIDSQYMGWAPLYTMLAGFRTTITQPGVLLALLLSAPFLGQGQERQSVAELVEQFKSTTVFWQQMEVAKKIVQLRNLSVLPQLESWLTQDDRHIRGNAAFIYAGLGDPRGFDVITAILRDHSERPEGQGIPGGRWSLQGQLRADRYYAVHLLGELREPNAVPVLLPPLKDHEVNYKVAWALGEIGGEAAVQGLVQALHDTSPDVRVIAIHAIEKLNARETLPDLRPLLNDHERSHLGNQVSVAEAAQAAIAKLEARRN